MYIDKSTPVCGTFNNYLNQSICPKNPLGKRVVDTAEFVPRKAGDKSSSTCERLQKGLDWHQA